MAYFKRPTSLFNSCVILTFVCLIPLSCYQSFFDKIALKGPENMAILGLHAPNFVQIIIELKQHFLSLKPAI
jgi:hypothetical protein